MKRQKEKMNAERNGSSAGQILHVVETVSCGFLVLSFSVFQTKELDSQSKFLT